MSFKEQVKRDNKSIFNENEFAEELRFVRSNKPEETILGIIDTDILQQKYSDISLSLPEGSIVLFTNHEFNNLNTNETVILNNMLYTIIKITRDFGVLEIILGKGKCSI